MINPQVDGQLIVAGTSMTALPFDQKWRPASESITGFEKHLAVAVSASEVDTMKRRVDGLSELFPDRVCHINELSR